MNENNPLPEYVRGDKFFVNFCNKKYRATCLSADLINSQYEYLVYYDEERSGVKIERIPAIMIEGPPMYHGMIPLAVPNEPVIRKRRVKRKVRKSIPETGKPTARKRKASTPPRGPVAKRGKDDGPVSEPGSSDEEQFEPNSVQAFGLTPEPAEDPDLLSEEEFIHDAVPEIFVPELLESVLLKDGFWIQGGKNFLTLPSKITVDVMCDMFIFTQKIFFQKKLLEDSTAIIQVLVLNFNAVLKTKLLFHEEEYQYVKLGMRGKVASAVYGGNHLLRMFSKPAETSLEPVKNLSIVQKSLIDSRLNQKTMALACKLYSNFLQYIADNSAMFLEFVP